MWKLIRKYGWTAIRSGWRWTAKYRVYLLIGALAGAGLYILSYVTDHAEMKIQISAKTQELERLKDRDMQLMKIIEQRDQQIIRMNERRMQELAEMRMRLADARMEATEARATRDRITEELAMTRFQTLEAMRDDEEFADWISEPVPATGWMLLREASEGNPR